MIYLTRKFFLVYIRVNIYIERERERDLPEMLLFPIEKYCNCEQFWMVAGIVPRSPFNVG